MKCKAVLQLKPWHMPGGNTPDPFDIVVRCVAAAYRVDETRLTGGDRTAKVAWARRVAIWIYGRMSGESHGEVARRFGKDRSSVSWATGNVRDALSVYPKLAKVVDIKRINHKGK